MMNVVVNNVSIEILYNINFFVDLLGCQKYQKLGMKDKKHFGIAKAWHY